MQKHILKHRKNLEQEIPARFQGMSPLPEGFRNGARKWHIHDADKPGLRTMDIEHVPEGIVREHNDPDSDKSAISLYHPGMCIHNCPSCFSHEADVYGKSQRLMNLAATLAVVDSALAIAKSEGHQFESLKFLGPGELLMNPDLFRIIGEYEKRGIVLSIFTKGALLGHDGLARKYQGHSGIGSGNNFITRLAACGNVNLLFSFQSFDPQTAQSLVSTREGLITHGLRGYAAIRNKAITEIMKSGFYRADGTTERVCILNAPMVPENIDESFGIYRFFIERGTPVVMTPTMVSGKGSCQLARQNNEAGQDEFQRKVVELYSDIYLYNISKGIQTLGQVETEGISSYVGAEPCNQVAHGVFVRANGDVQVCVGRRDKETLLGNVQDEPLGKIWARSPHSKQNPKNNRCPAKDARCAQENEMRVFHLGFYEKVMERLREKLAGRGFS